MLSNQMIGGSPTNAVLNLSASMYVLSVMSARDTDLSDYTSTIVIAVIVAILKYTDNLSKTSQQPLCIHNSTRIIY